MGTIYITDDMADSNGEIHREIIDADGKKGDITNDRHIGMIVNCPNSKFMADSINLENFYKGCEFRAAKETHVGEFASTDMFNDDLSICASHVTIDKFVAVSTIEKVYSDSNHPDRLQIFNHKTKKVKGILIKHFETFSRNFDKQGSIHLTENHHYEDICIGSEALIIDTDAALYPYFFSATNVNGLILGGKNTKITAGKTMRVKDVKRSGIMSHKSNYLVNIDPALVEATDDFRFQATTKVPMDIYNSIFKDIPVQHQKTFAEVLAEQAALAGKQGY